MFEHDAVIVGGCGHVGLPLALALAERGLHTVALDVNPAAVESVNDGRMPFAEPGGEELLAKVLGAGTFRATSDAGVVSSCEHVVVVIGTPVDEHLNPDPQVVPDAVAALREHLRDGQLVVLRSTVFPGVTRLVERVIERFGKDIDVSFCPERIAEGRALVELYELPQIVSGCSPRAVERAAALFGHLTGSIVETTPEEAELAKLFTNTWRYIKFAAANQLYVIANDYGVDFERVRRAITFDYPRAADMPGAGFAAGPCLFKDTMQLAAVHKNNFTLGHASMMVNEGFPLYLVDRIERRYDLSVTTVGVLGMAFKGDSDDTRSSLAYKLRRILRSKAKAVLCHDPYVTTDAALSPLDEVLAAADLLVIAAPHSCYRELRPQVPVVDVWNLLGNGVAT